MYKYNRPLEIFHALDNYTGAKQVSNQLSYAPFFASTRRISTPCCPPPLSPEKNTEKPSLEKTGQ